MFMVFKIIYRNIRDGEIKRCPKYNLFFRLKIWDGGFVNKKSTKLA